VGQESETEAARPKGVSGPPQPKPAKARPVVEMRRDAKLKGEALEAARVLFETTTHPMQAIAAQVGVSPGTLSRYVWRLGWTRGAGTSRAPQRTGAEPTGKPSVRPSVRMRSDAKLTGEMLEAARVLFETTTQSMQAIGEQVGVSAGTMHRYAERQGWVRGRESAPASSPAGMICPGVGLCPARPMTLRKLFDTMAERIARCQAEGAEGSADERERGVRSLGSLTRMFERLSAMDRALAHEERGLPREGAAAGARAAAEEIAPYDLEGLRRELSRELDKLVGERGE
jgi:hypothetical protein